MVRWRAQDYASGVQQLHRPVPPRPRQLAHLAGRQQEDQRLVRRRGRIDLRVPGAGGGPQGQRPELGHRPGQAGQRQGRGLRAGIRRHPEHPLRTGHAVRHRGRRRGRRRRVRAGRTGRGRRLSVVSGCSTASASGRAPSSRASPGWPAASQARPCWPRGRRRPSLGCRRSSTRPATPPASAPTAMGCWTRARVDFTLKAAATAVQLDVLNAAGAVVQSVALGPRAAGANSATWNGRAHRRRLGAGGQLPAARDRHRFRRRRSCRTRPPSFSQAALGRWGVVADLVAPTAVGLTAAWRRDGSRQDRRPGHLLGADQRPVGRPPSSCR